MWTRRSDRFLQVEARGLHWRFGYIVVRGGLSTGRGRGRMHCSNLYLAFSVPIPQGRSYPAVRLRHADNILQKNIESSTP